MGICVHVGGWVDVCVGVGMGMVMIGRVVFGGGRFFLASDDSGRTRHSPHASLSHTPPTHKTRNNIIIEQYTHN